MAATDHPGLLALLQLSSPNLPVGAFSYSQGLESAVDTGLIHDMASTQGWISDCLQLIIGRYDAPLWLRLYAALSSRNWAAANDWNEDYRVSRETSELAAEARQMGYSAERWLESLGQAIPTELDRPAFITAHSWACTQWRISSQDGLQAYLFAWAENQVMAALKAVPLGQAAGQQILLQLRPTIVAISQAAIDMPDEKLSTQAPGFALVCCQHETQYSRLFRS